MKHHAHFFMRELAQTLILCVNSHKFFIFAWWTHGCRGKRAGTEAVFTVAFPPGYARVTPKHSNFGSFPWGWTLGFGPLKMAHFSGFPGQKGQIRGVQIACYAARPRSQGPDPGTRDPQKPRFAELAS